MFFDPIQRRRIGVTALFLAMVFFAVAAAAGVGNAIARNSAANQLATRDQDCVNSMKLLGAKTVTADSEQGTIKAKWDDLSGGVNTLSSASAAAMACPGWKMQSFCMGEGCTEKGASLSMIRVATE